MLLLRKFQSVAWQQRGVLGVALATLVLIWTYWLASAQVNYHGDLTGHINVGHPFLDKSHEEFQPRVQVQFHVGFDGQFFLYLACDPFLLKNSTIQRLDAPQLRARRIAYPLLVWALSGAHARWTPLMMFWVCAVAIAVTTALLAAWFRQRGGSPALALLFPLSYITIMIYHSLTSESLALALVAASVFALERERPRLSLLLAMAAAMTKEATLLWPLAVVLHNILNRHWRSAALFCLAPLPLVGWIFYLHYGRHLGLTVQDDAKNLSWPLAGALHQLIGIIRVQLHDHNPYPADVLMICVIVAAPFAAAVCLWHDRSPMAIAFALAALLSVSLPSADAYWCTNNYTRQSFLLGLFLFVNAARLWPRKTSISALALLSSVAGLSYLSQYLAFLAHYLGGIYN